MNQIKIGKFIAECRKKQNLTQKELAEKLNITDRAVSKWERGINLPDIVRFDYKNRSSIGYMKYDENLFNNNSLEFVLYQLLKEIQIDSAKTLRVYNDVSCKNPVAILSIDVTDGTDYEFINFREMRDELFFDLKNKTIPESKWIKDWIVIRNRKIYGSFRLKCTLIM